jgi:hypothetical protein
MNVTIPQKLGATKVLMAPAAVSVQQTSPQRFND